MFFGLERFRHGLDLGYKEIACYSDEEAISKITSIDGLTVYKVIEPSPLPGKIPVRVIFYREPDNDLAKKYWPNK